jgi:hypothetical protein
MKETVQSLTVVNGTAERAIATFSKYCHSLSKDKKEKQTRGIITGTLLLKFF